MTPTLRVTQSALEALAQRTGMVLPWARPAPRAAAWKTEITPDLLHATRVFSEPDVTVELDLAVQRTDRVDRLHCWARLAAGQVSALVASGAPELEFSWFGQPSLEYHLTRLATPGARPHPPGRFRAIVAGHAPSGRRRLGAREWVLGKSGWRELSPARSPLEPGRLGDPWKVRLSPIEPSGIGATVAELVWAVRA